MSKLIRNAVKCLSCGVVLVSQHVHDFNGCPCGVYVDGGLDYTRRVFPADKKPSDAFLEMSEYAE